MSRNPLEIRAQKEVAGAQNAKTFLGVSRIFPSNFKLHTRLEPMSNVDWKIIYAENMVFYNERGAATFD